MPEKEEEIIIMKFNTHTQTRPIRSYIFIQSSVTYDGQGTLDLALVPITSFGSHSNEC